MRFPKAQYKLKGNLKKVKGTWHEIDFENSVLDSSISESEFQDLAIDALMDEQIDPTGYDIILGTHYEIENTAEGRNVLILKGYAIVSAQDEENINPNRFISFSV